uniref:F-box/LRR-repeat protein 15/At3g58940/PEG3-like LRR domain-containing protein n=1 Tax=Oryza brachyantha TaxID=4533 RepID=J3MI09_ORYBR
MEAYDLDASSIPHHLVDRDAAFAAHVDRVVFNHSGPGIKFMSLKHTRYDTDGDRRVTAWLDRLASRDHHLLERLDVSIGAAMYTPPSLFRCTTLVDLRLDLHAAVRGLDDGAVHLPVLRRLSLEHTGFNSSTHFQNLIDGCPLLEMLHLRFTALAHREDTAGIVIGSPSLRRVVLEGCGGYGTVPFEVTAPNVDEFVFSGRNVVALESGGVRRLAARKVSLLMDDKTWFYHMFASFQVMPFFNVGSNMSRIMSGFQGVVELAISGWCIEYLSRIVDCIELPELGIQTLRVEGMWPNEGQAGIVLHLLRSSPCLRSLFITNELDHPMDISIDVHREQYPKTPEFLFDDMPGRLSHLRRFFMFNFTGNHNEISIINFVLSSSCISIDPDQFGVTDVLGNDWSSTQLILASYVLVNSQPWMHE